MDVIEFATAGNIGSLQKLRRLLAKAVTESRGNTAKVAWLSAVLGEAAGKVATDAAVNFADLTSDQTSNATQPELLNELIRNGSRSSALGTSDFKSQLVTDILDAKTILDA